MITKVLHLHVIFCQTVIILSHKRDTHLCSLYQTSGLLLHAEDIAGFSPYIAIKNAVITCFGYVTLFYESTKEQQNNYLFQLSCTVCSALCHRFTYFTVYTELSSFRVVLMNQQSDSSGRLQQVFFCVEILPISHDYAFGSVYRR